MLLVPRSLKSRLSEDKLTSLFKKPKKRDSVSSASGDAFHDPFKFADSDTPTSASSTHVSSIQISTVNNSEDSDSAANGRSAECSTAPQTAPFLHQDNAKYPGISLNYSSMPAHSANAVPVVVETEPDDASTTPAGSSDTRVDHAVGHLDPNSRYTSFTSECISLTNSEMTSNFEIDSVVEQEENLNDEEDINDYKVGGYHPVKLGDIYHSSTSHNNYKIIKKLGWGHFSTVWLCKSIELQEFFAIKVVKSSDVYKESALDEIKILEILKQPGNEHLIRLRDSFFVQGINGSHVCLVFDLLGESLLSYIKEYRQYKKSQSFFVKLKLKEDYGGLPINLVKSITTQVLEAIDYTHKKGIIHTDLKPENILIATPTESINEDYVQSNCFIKPSKPLKSNITSKNMQIKVSDFGNATYVHHHFTNQIQTRQYRAPEVILRHDNWGASADMWSLGCVVFELITGDYLFDPHDGGDNFSKDEDHLAQIIELLGYFPNPSYLSKCKYFDTFFEINNGELELRHIKKLKYWTLENVLTEKYKFKNDNNVKLLSDFIAKCLGFELSNRYDAASLLKHPWLDSNSGYTMYNLPNMNSHILGFMEETEPPANPDDV